MRHRKICKLVSINEIEVYREEGNENFMENREQDSQ